MSLSITKRPNSAFGKNLLRRREQNVVHHKSLSDIMSISYLKRVLITIPILLNLIFLNVKVKKYENMENMVFS